MKQLMEPKLRPHTQMHPTIQRLLDGDRRSRDKVAGLGLGEYRLRETVGAEAQKDFL